MSDTISRQAIYETLCRIWDKADSEEFDKEVFATIKNFPSAQPEVIRCKDCSNRPHCKMSTAWAVVPDDDWFCGDAERRTE